MHPDVSPCRSQPMESASMVKIGMPNDGEVSSDDCQGPITAERKEHPDE